MAARAVLAAAVSLGLSLPAAAQGNCGLRADIVKVLAEKYGERARAIGLQSPTSMIEVWASAETGTWTLLATDASGAACIVATGRHWQQQPAETPGKGL